MTKSRRMSRPMAVFGAIFLTGISSLALLHVACGTSGPVPVAAVAVGGWGG